MTCGNSVTVVGQREQEHTLVCNRPATDHDLHHGPARWTGGMYGQWTGPDDVQIVTPAQVDMTLEAEQALLDLRSALFSAREALALCDTKYTALLRTGTTDAEDDVAIVNALAQARISIAAALWEVHR